MQLGALPGDLAHDRGKGFLVVLPHLPAPQLPQFLVPALASQRVVLPDASALAPQPPPISLGLPSLPDRQAFRLHASF